MITALLILATIGYLLVIFENVVGINKTIVSIIIGSLCWIIIALYNPHQHENVVGMLMENFAEIASLLIFLLGAMTIVEMIDIHKGFSVITNRIRTRSVLKLLWIIGLITFSISCLLDNLATTVIMVMLLKKLMPKSKIRLILAGIVVIAANAGGAFSPVGDVTTTLLWIGGQITAASIILTLLFPSLIVIIVPLIIASFTIKGFAMLRVQVSMAEVMKEEKMRGSVTVLVAGLLGLAMVPVIKGITGLPPFVGIMISLGFVTLVSSFYHRNKEEEEKEKYTISSALRKVDISSILYFMGILLMVMSLKEVNILSQLATFLEDKLPNHDTMVIALGFLSSLIDNGSLVAATQGMFPLSVFPQNDSFWDLIALCAGTGGSIFVIGSAAGITIMEKEKVTFGWYARNITPLAIIGYIFGILAFFLQKYLFGF